MKKGQPCAGPLELARPERFERPTPWFVAKYSIHLSYGREGSDYSKSVSEFPTDPAVE